MKTTWLTLTSMSLLVLGGLRPVEAASWEDPQELAWNYNAWADAPMPGQTQTPSPSNPGLANGQAPTTVPSTELQQQAGEYAVAAPASRWCQCGSLGEPWRLPQPCILQQHGIEIGGWTQAGVYTNAHGAGTNGPLGFNNETDFNLHQQWFYAEKKTNTDDGCWDLGGRIDYVFGVDGPDTQAFGDGGWDFGWNSSNYYGSAIPQLYLELAFGDWSIKGGRFFTPIGYEVIPATGNFFFSHSYAQYYAEPFTHTGFLVTRKIGDRLSAFGGWVDGWDSGWENLNGADNFLGGFNFTLSERTTFTYSLVTGNWGRSNVSTNEGDIFMNSFVLTHKLSDKWTYVFQHDLGLNTNNPNGNGQWYGVNQYLFYQWNDCWAGGIRAEWFHDDDGVRVVSPDFNGAAGDYYEVTLGLNYKPHANVVIRPELRWDWYNGNAAAGNRPFNNGQSNSQFAGGVDAIFTF